MSEEWLSSEGRQQSRSIARASREPQKALVGRAQSALSPATCSKKTIGHQREEENDLPDNCSNATAYAGVEAERQMSDGHPKHDSMSIEEAMISNMWEIAAVVRPENWRPKMHLLLLTALLFILWVPGCAGPIMPISNGSQSDLPDSGSTAIVWGQHKGAVGETVTLLQLWGL